MIKTVIKGELRNIARDKMYLFLAIYPFIFGYVGYLLVNYVDAHVAPTSLAPEIIVMFLILMTSYMFGAIMGFTLLDDKDDKVLIALKVTPISVKYYVSIKVVLSFVFALLATIIFIIFTDFLPTASLWQIILITIASAMQAPGVTLIVNAFARNKVEGFVIMKISGMILILPMVAFYVLNWQEVFLGIAPGFYSARMIQMILLPNLEYNFTFVIYFIIGMLYNIVLLYLLSKLYFKKANI